MSDVTRLDNLKKQAEKLRREHDRAQGELDAAMKRLLEEFEVEDLEEAQALLKEFEEKRDKANKAFHDGLDEFDEKWGEVLGG